MQNLTINWIFRYFNELGLQQLYDLLAERQRVFIVEQSCPFQDADRVDLECWHLLGYMNFSDKPELAVYSRLVPAGVTFAQASIGRIITSEKARGTGAGLALVHESIRRLEGLWGKVPIKIGAQRYLIKFYGKFGFEVVGEPYIEDGIPHVHMLRKAGLS